MIKIIFACIAVLSVSCSSLSSKSEKKIKNDVPEDRKITLDVEDLVLDDGMAVLPIKITCIPGQESVALETKGENQFLKCEAGKVQYTHKFPISDLKASRAAKKDHVIRLRSYKSDEKDKTMAQTLVVVSYKDYQTKLVIHQNLLTINGMDGIFSDLSAHGQCIEDSNIEVEVFDEGRGVSLEDAELPCGEAGFHFFTRKPGVVKKGMRLLIRQKKGDKAVASYEVKLFS